MWRIDAFVVRCWQSGIGNRRIAFEVKTSRSDFLTEIRSPAKRREALELSHQFFFATPQGLVSPTEIPPECGLIEVNPKGGTRIVVKAPVRDPRGLRMSEAIYLMRKPLYGGGVLQLRREVLQAEASAKHSGERAESLRESLGDADRLLARYGGHLVVKGSEWRGRWQPHTWRPALVETAVYVESVEPIVYGDGPDGMRVVVRRLDGKDTWPWTFYSVGSFLRVFVPT